MFRCISVFLGNPSSNEIVCDIGSQVKEFFAQKLHHFIKYLEFINGNCVHHFTSHSRFGYWAYNILYGKILLG